MAKKLDKVDVVVVGTGWAGGIVSAELAKAGHKVVALERGENRNLSDYTGVKDELRYTNRFEMMQNLSHETVTSRNEIDGTALPDRTKEEMMAGTDLGVGASTMQERPIDMILTILKYIARQTINMGRKRYLKIW